MALAPGRHRTFRYMAAQHLVRARISTKASATDRTLLCSFTATDVRAVASASLSFFSSCRVVSSNSTSNSASVAALMSLMLPA